MYFMLPAARATSGNHGNGISLFHLKNSGRSRCLLLLTSFSTSIQSSNPAEPGISFMPAARFQHSHACFVHGLWNCHALYGQV